MAAAVTCPVCGFANIPEDSDSCPQCDSDLVCFRLLDGLSDVPADGAGSPGQNSSAALPNPAKPSPSRFVWPACAAAAGLLILAVVLGYTASRFAMMTQAMGGKRNQGWQRWRQRWKRTALSSGRPARPSGNQSGASAQVLKAVQHLQETPPVATRPAPQEQPHSPDPATCFKQYQAKDTDTLWGISRALYGSGFFYPVLMEHNPDLEIYNISSKDTLRCLCDKTAVPEIYRKITATRHGKRYWKYQIRPQDTRQSVVRRYCPQKPDKLGKLDKSNENGCLVDEIPFIPGATIGIYLE